VSGRLVKAFHYARHGSGANELAVGYYRGMGLAAEMVGTFVLVYTDPKRKARDSHVPVLVRRVHGAPDHPATGAWGRQKAREDHWMFLVGPLLAAAVAIVPAPIEPRPWRLAQQQQQHVRLGLAACSSFPTACLFKCAWCE
jgi:hypothetical protein